MAQSVEQQQQRKRTFVRRHSSALSYFNSSEYENNSNREEEDGGESFSSSTTDFSAAVSYPIKDTSTNRSMFSPDRSSRRPSLVRRGSYDMMRRLSASMGTPSLLSSTRRNSRHHPIDPTTVPDEMTNDDDDGYLTNNDGNSKTTPSSSSSSTTKGTTRSKGQSNTLLVTRILRQIPSILLIGLFHLMIGIPFGVSYFPIYSEGGPFPLSGSKEALGIRMFLFSTIVAQIVFTFKSKFKNPIGLQMVENVPFCHELFAIVVDHQGYTTDAISTLIFIFGFSSIVVGLVFWILGRYKLGRVIHFFPTHVLIGCIAGIGVFLAKTGLEMTMDDKFSFQTLADNWNLLWLVFLLEFLLRILEQLTKDEHGKARYPLLSPIYFCMITPIFYLGLAILGVPTADAEDAGYFFPSLEDDDGDDGQQQSNWWTDIFQDDALWNMWTVINFQTISWSAIFACLPTIFALTLFSLIHVPINIPAFSISSNQEADMNNELIAHGYSNILAGMFCGLQNYMAYTQSLIYDRSGGTGKVSGIVVATVTTLLFFIGPAIASYIPKCMAGTLLLHVGLDLFLEGVWDTYGKFDMLEYSGILLIVVVMTAYGMEAAMVAGIIAAVSTYVVQSVIFLSPIRGFMPATTLRSSILNRSTRAEAILQFSNHGRSRIHVIQLQGHLFFGNMAHLTESIDYLMSSLMSTDADDDHFDTTASASLPPIVVIMDCSLVLGIDSSAAQAMTKLKDTLLRNHQVELCIFVSGSSDGFPTEFNLSSSLTGNAMPVKGEEGDNGQNDCRKLEQINEETALLAMKSIQTEEQKAHTEKYCGSCVCDFLDEALIMAENALISRQDPTCLTDGLDSSLRFSKEEGRQKEGNNNNDNKKSSQMSEQDILISCLIQICPVPMSLGDAEALSILFQREEYTKDEYIWKQGETSASVKILVEGALISLLENEAGTTEKISSGCMIGELGLLNGDARMSSVVCLSDAATVYSMSKSSFEELVRTQPRIARFLDLICIKYLAHRLQHVSNRIFETRCLPI